MLSLDSIKTKLQNDIPGLTVSGWLDLSSNATYIGIPKAIVTNGPISPDPNAVLGGGGVVGVGHLAQDVIEIITIDLIVPNCATVDKLKTFHDAIQTALLNFNVGQNRYSRVAYRGGSPVNSSSQFIHWRDEYYVNHILSA